MRSFDDFKPGEIIDLGSTTITEEAIIAFARIYDPQPFHLDDAAARDTMLGGLAASGWHTASLLMRLLCDHLLLESTSLGAPGIEDLKWMRPVRPGDTLSAKAIVRETRRSGSRPDMGIVSFHFQMTNDAGKQVLDMNCPIFFGMETPS